jgi:predicted ribosome quality control (RQC) complex YloA/Tae2 family protein
VGELSGFEVLALAKEISGALRGTYVNNIYTVGASQLLRFRRPSSEDVWLVASPKKGVWVSSKVSERAETAGFTSKLRSKLERGRFVGASQYDLDRVFALDFEGADGARLIVELMPPGNILVTDSGGKISLSLREVRTGERRIVRGETYSPPRQSRISPSDVRPEDIKEMTRREGTVGRALGRHVALPRKYVSECLRRLGLEDGSPSTSLAGREAETAGVLGAMVAEARENYRPCVCETEKGDEIFVLPPTGLKVKESAQTVSELCDSLFLEEVESEAESPSPEEGKRRELETTISRLRRESESLLTEAAKARAAAESARTMNLLDAAALLQESGVRPTKEPSSAASVASILYDHAKGLSAKSSESVSAADKLEKRLNRIIPPRTSGAKLIPRGRREWYEKFRWFYTSEGKLAVGGRDAQTNSALIQRHLDDIDTVYHADLFGSPFFVLKGGKGQTDGEVRQVAQATVAFSSAWKTGLGAADAYWVAPEQVSSAAPSGEYLPRGSFAIRGRKNFVNKVIVEVAVALDNGGRVVAGPEEALKKQSGRYLLLRPQREKGSDTAKRVAKELAAMVEGGVLPPTLDDVQRALPTGGGKISRRG